MVSVTFEESIYDITAWVDKHPGGRRLLLTADGCDVTEVFKSYHNKDSIEGYPGVKRIGPKKATPHKPFKFTEGYRRLQKKAYGTRKLVANADVLLYLAIATYYWCIFMNVPTFLNSVVAGLAMCLMGAFGHQYIHESSEKSVLITVVGFLGGHWRYEHVFEHHPFTNTPRDVDLVAFMDINKISPYVPSFIRFMGVSSFVVIRPYVALYWLPKYVKFATLPDVIAATINLVDLYLHYQVGAYGIFLWYFRRWIPSAWFLTIDYFNHYRNVALERVSDSWMDQQLATSQNFVLNEWLYDTHPYIHSLICFGLDRQVEHHLFPRLRLEELGPAGRLVEADPTMPPIKKHFVGFGTIKALLTEFV